MRRVVTLNAIFAIAALVVSCAKGDTSHVAASDSGHLGDANGKDVIADDVNDDTAPEEGGITGSVRVRFVQLSTDLPPVSICLSLHGLSSFYPPYVHAGLGFPAVTRYYPIPEGTYDVRLVSPNDGAPSCAADPLWQAPSALVVEKNARVTLLFSGRFAGDPAPAIALQAKTIVDDLAIATDAARMRFVQGCHATTALDFGTVWGSEFTPLAADVAYGFASAWVVQAPDSAGVNVTARESKSAVDYASMPWVPMVAGDVISTFLLCNTAAGPRGRFLLCHDRKPAGGNGLAVCDGV